MTQGTNNYDKYQIGINKKPGLTGPGFLLLSYALRGINLWYLLPTLRSWAFLSYALRGIISFLLIRQNNN